MKKQHTNILLVYNSLDKLFNIFFSFSLCQTHGVVKPHMEIVIHYLGQEKTGAKCHKRI